MFEFSERSKELQKRVSGFMDEHVFPNEGLYGEQVASGDRWQPVEIVEDLKAKARAQ